MLKCHILQAFHHTNTSHFIWCYTCDKKVYFPWNYPHIIILYFWNKIKRYCSSPTKKCQVPIDSYLFSRCEVLSSTVDVVCLNLFGFSPHQSQSSPSTFFFFFKPFAALGCTAVDEYPPFHSLYGFLLALSSVEPTLLPLPSPDVPGALEWKKKAFTCKATSSMELMKHCPHQTIHQVLPTAGHYHV